MARTILPLSWSIPTRTWFTTSFPSFGRVDRVPGLNLLDPKLFPNRDRCVDTIVTTVRYLWETWGNRLEDLLRKGLSIIYEYNSHPDTDPSEMMTIMDILKLLDDGDTVGSGPNARTVMSAYQQSVLRRCTDPRLEQWFDSYLNWPRDTRAEAVGPVHSRIGAYASNERASVVMGMRESTITLDSVLSEGAVLLVATASGVIGQGPAALMGGTSVSLLESAMRDQERLPSRERKKCLLVCDEFQTITGANWEGMFAEIRKYGCSMMLATQSLARLDTGERRLRSGIMGNVGCIVAHQMSAEDARLVAPEMDEDRVKVRDLVNIHPRGCVVRINSDTTCYPAFSMSTMPPPDAVHGSTESVDLVVQASEAYTVDFAETRRQMNDEISEVISRSKKGSDSGKDPYSEAAGGRRNRAGKAAGQSSGSTASPDGSGTPPPNPDKLLSLLKHMREERESRRNPDAADPDPSVVTGPVVAPVALEGDAVPAAAPAQQGDVAPAPVPAQQVPAVPEPSAAPDAPAAGSPVPDAGDDPVPAPLVAGAPAQRSVPVTSNEAKSGSGVLYSPVGTALTGVRRIASGTLRGIPEVDIANSSYSSEFLEELMRNANHDPGIRRVLDKRNGDFAAKVRREAKAEGLADAKVEASADFEEALRSRDAEFAAALRLKDAEMAAALAEARETALAQARMELAVSLSSGENPSPSALPAERAPSPASAADAQLLDDAPELPLVPPVAEFPSVEAPELPYGAAPEGDALGALSVPPSSLRQADSIFSGGDANGYSATEGSFGYDSISFGAEDVADLLGSLEAEPDGLSVPATQSSDRDAVPSVASAPPRPAVLRGRRS